MQDAISGSKLLYPQYTRIVREDVLGQRDGQFGIADGAEPN